MTGSEEQAGSTEGKVKIDNYYLEGEKIALQFASLVDPNYNSKQHLERKYDCCAHKHLVVWPHLVWPFPCSHPADTATTPTLSTVSSY